MYDNSVTVGQNEIAPNPRLVLHMDMGKIIWPTDIIDERRTSDWAKPILQAGQRL